MTRLFLAFIAGIVVASVAVAIHETDAERYYRENAMIGRVVLKREDIGCVLVQFDPPFSYVPTMYLHDKGYSLGQEIVVHEGASGRVISEKK